MAQLTVLERFWSKVDKTSDCWLWEGPLDRYGYGKFSVNSRTMIAHRWGYAALVGPIPEGLTLDHVCHSKVADECSALPDLCVHRRCVNPAHLEPVTQLENRRRGGRGGHTGDAVSHLWPACKRGHEWTAENTIIEYDGGRRCRTCRREYQRVPRPQQRAG